MFAAVGGFRYYDIAGGDPYWNNVSLLENFEYPSVSAVDLSSNNFQMMITGNARPSTRSPFSAGNGGSYKFDTSTASQIIFPTSTVYNAGSNNFTAECWAYIPAFPGNNTELIAIATNSATVAQATCRIVVTSGGAVYFLCNNATNSWINTSTTAGGTIIAGLWYHYAAVRNGSNFTLYINGVSKLTYTYSGVVGYLTSSTTHLGNLPVGTGFTGASNCYITNARWVNGTAVYTSAFTPPTTPLTAIANTQMLVTFAQTGYQNNTTFVDYSINSFVPTLTNTPKYSGLSPFTNAYPGSMKFYGTSYVTIATNAAFTYGTNDFTIETWVYFTSIGTTQYIIDQRNSGTANAVIPTLYLNSGGNLRYFVSNSDRILGAATLTTDTWYHVAVCRSGTSTKLFLNGTQDGSTYTDTSNYAASRVVIGSQGDTASNYLNGYMSSVRLTKGVALYTTTFTPSTVPLTASSSTSLLMNGIGGFNDLSKYGQPITNPSFSGSLTSNVAQSNSISTVQKKWGTQSSFYSLNGYHTVSDATSLRFGTGDFTVEGWVYRNASGVAHSIICKGTSTTGWALTINASNQLVWTSTTTNLKTSTTTIPATTWTYFAITRSGTTGYMFINGTQEGSSYTDNTNYNQADNMLIGVDRLSSNGLTGYLDDIRITTGVCRYTASFTAPTTTFPTS
jgi:hypothetical protein